ncbi:hypothetical protein [Mycolicibacterium fluoranthenivorans]|uniref:Uncharacterized protein n=1 Tax=Mycolicibacterium fluoranthenivorans TaxID=258505 RepID=A0A7X5U5T8_9MYCO|nr:hypothetical protein [Mycolicibacterium fluoranthenivorans]MCV7359181.1 hypothetical protein [Mycolicibacterium fluoranthenivorans]NIH98931.1 hypothetical protein [Mycolicibacterium fluoranthenivorans]
MDICFIDTETLGLHPDAPVWDFAAVRRFAAGGEDKTEFRIRHDPAHWLDELAKAPHGQQFVDDYLNRYVRSDAATEFDAAVMMNIVTRGALVVACNPGFDLPRIDKLIVKHGMTPSYHYHPFDISSIVFGALATASRLDGKPPLFYTPDGPPWKSDALAAYRGVKAEDYARHTAAGDVAWTVAQWDAVIGTKQGTK